MTTKALTLREKKEDFRVTLYKKMAGEITKALPRYLSDDRQKRCIVSAINKNPKLLDCDQLTLWSSILEACQMGLEIDTSMQESHLIPYGKTAQLIVGYRGLEKLAYNSGYVSNISVRLVHANDKFDISYGLEPDIQHKPTVVGDRGDIVGAYAIAYMKGDARPIFEFMTVEELESVRAKSRAKNEGPWVTDKPEMYKKTVIRRVLKHVPKSSELQKALYYEDMAEIGKPQGTESEHENIRQIIDVKPSKIDELVPDDTSQGEAEETPSESTRDRLDLILDLTYIDGEGNPNRIAKSGVLRKYTGKGRVADLSDGDIIKMYQHLVEDKGYTPEKIDEELFAEAATE